MVSSLGRCIAHQYASRGAKLCIVGRGGQYLERVARECLEVYMKNGFEGHLGDDINHLLTISINANVPEEISRIHRVIDQGSSASCSLAVNQT